MDKITSNTLLATVDLGSNSFHLLVAKIDNGEVKPVLTRGEKVQLAAGLKNGLLDQEAVARGLQCLAQFRQVLTTLQPDSIRVVGTNALRAAKNASLFIEQGSKILGHSIQIISGREEARLIYLGVAHTLSDDQQARLVIDIGGGSTEFIIGQRFESKLLESLHIGCVSYREQFFPGDKISIKRFEQAYRKACMETLNIRENFQAKGWNEVIGSSGTFNAIASLLDIDGKSELITRSGLEQLKTQICNIGSIDGLKNFEKLKPHRRATLPAGVAICSAIFDTLDIKQLRTSAGALREGLAYDLVGRLAHEDVRERTITAMMNRYEVEPDRAERVEQFARQMFQQTQADWNLTKADSELLSWAARLHEIGLSISHSQFHKHGQYLIKNSDLAGFSFSEQSALGLLVRGHRRKFPASLFAKASHDHQKNLQRLCLLLRLAVLFKYVTPIEGKPEFKINAEPHGCTLIFQPGWLESHPLTHAELNEEQQYLANTQFSLSIV